MDRDLPGTVRRITVGQDLLAEDEHTLEFPVVLRQVEAPLIGTSKSRPLRQVKVRGVGDPRLARLIRLSSRAESSLHPSTHRWASLAEAFDPHPEPTEPDDEAGRQP